MPTYTCLDQFLYRNDFLNAGAVISCAKMEGRLYLLKSIYCERGSEELPSAALISQVGFA